MAPTNEASPRNTRPEYRAPAKNVHHGRTMAAWVGTAIAMVGLVVGGIAVIMQNWPMFWVGVALLVVALIATKALQSLGHGAN